LVLPFIIDGQADITHGGSALRRPQVDFRRKVTDQDYSIKRCHLAPPFHFVKENNYLNSIRRALHWHLAFYKKTFETSPAPPGLSHAHTATSKNTGAVPGRHYSWQLEAAKRIE
jgi:hypothetical protein